MLLSLLSFSCLRFLNGIFQRPLCWVFLFYLFISHHFINWREKIWICTCAAVFFPTFALNISERNYLWTGKSGYSRLLCNDALYKSISIFHLIEKSVYHMPLKALVLTTHTLLMAWMVSISLSVLQNGTQSTIDRRWFLPSSWQAHEIFFCLLISCTLLNGI